MDIAELQSYRLSDAVKFNDRLNPRLWGPDEHLLPEVKEKLMAIADDFREFLGITDLDIRDITISGSNAAYTYTPHSDIDLHLVVDLPRADISEVYRELFDAKKYAYNDQHDFKIGGYDVELYVQNANEPHYSQGIYSLMNDEWKSVPKRRKPEIDDISVKSKYEDLGARIESAIQSGDLDKMDAVAQKIKNLRGAGLEKTGEFGPENLAFKVLRNNGTLDQLRQARLQAKDSLMSLDERKKKKKSRSKYGSFGGMWFPGYGYYGQTGSVEAADGGGDGGGESVKESAEAPDTETLLRRFVDFVAKDIGIQDMPEVKFKRDPEWSRRNNTFGQYLADRNLLIVSLAGRHPMDVMRTVAHELTHHRQNEINPLPDDSGETGSEWENEANAAAGIIMRRFAQEYPEFFQSLNEVDTGQNPQPGDPIDWPEGTVHVKVSDVYDWYKLGQKISDLSTAKQGEFGSGVPETILVFNNEPQEEHMIDQLEKLGLDVHDVDPGETPGQEAHRDVDESLRGKLGAAAAAACIAGTPGCATTDAVKAVQTVGRTAKSLEKMGTAGAKEELQGELKNWLRRQAGQTDQPTKLPLPDIKREGRDEDFNINDPIVNYDIPYSAIARPENLLQARRFGRISHYDNPNSSMAIISVPVSREKGFVNTMSTLRVPVKKSRLAEASGYIPTEAEKDDPRFSMALTQDIKPGQTGKEANKLGLETDSQGRPALLMKNLRNLLEATKQDIPVGAVLDLRGNYPKYSRLLARVDSILPNGKVQLTVVDAQGPGNAQTGTRISIAPNYIRKAPIVQEACWDGYRQQGMKRKGDRMVPNCVKVSEDDQDLFEVKMSPGELQKWAQSPEAEGIQAGFEAEMIFRDAEREGGGGESEPDYDMDQRAESIEEVVGFFQGGDNGISPGTARRLREALWEDYIEWREEQIYTAWEHQANDQVEDYMETHVWGDDEKREDYLNQAAEELGIETSEDRAERAEEIEKRARELFAVDVNFQIDQQGPYYDEARDDYVDQMADDDDYSEYEYFRDRGGAYMSDVADQQSLDWPYWTEGDYGGGGRDVNEIADSLSDALGGAEVRGSTGYHSVRRRPGLWIIEPDGSLDPDDSEDAGLEIVSPPMPLPQTLEALRKVIDWANSDGDAYTNGSTGLHMGISVPFKGGDVDYVKLILFLGDQYVLEKFGRAANSYTRSALGKLQDVQRRRRELDEADAMTGVEKTAAAMDLMKKNLIELAAQYVQDGVGKDKYTSAHIKDGYIEFRSPGGDYLSMDSRDESELDNTMLRFARAMQIASRPDLERQEYSKKLYKLLSGFKEATTVKTGKDTKYRTEIETYNDRDALELFAKYSTGQINAEELKKAWARGVLAKEQPKPRRGEKWEIYDQDTGEVLDVISGETEAELSMAVAGAVEQLSGKGINFSIRKQEEPGQEPSRRAKVAKKIIDRPTVWRITDTDSGKTLLVAAENAALAKVAAEQQDRHWFELRRNDPYSFQAEPATPAEVRQYMVQRADNKKDSEQVQQRVQFAPGRYRVTWTERRDDRQVQDSLTVDARNADNAMDLVRSALNAQGRQHTMVSADLAGSTQDIQRQRAQQSSSQGSGEFTGRWQVKDRQGNIVYTFSGVGNSQSDANRTAQTWLLSQGDRLDNLGPFDIVPEMR